MHSVARQSAGIGFTGHSYEHSFVLADVDMAWGHGRDEVILFFSPDGLVVVAPLPDGRFRVVATLDGDRVVRVDGDREHPLSRGYTCPKGRAEVARS